MTQVLPQFTELAGAIAGEVVTPGDPGYDDARRVWNADADRRPAAVAYCTSAADVSAAVLFARERSLEISVRSGAHSTSGVSVGDAGLTIDLSRMNSVSVDPEARRAVVAGGALLRDMDTATQEYGLATPAGEIGHTGVAGLTLGGGMGWLTRRHGLSIDNLLAAEVVLADGRIMPASDDENPDLFWAIRGGGGNFGIVTRFEFALHEVGPTVQVGMLFYDVDQAPDALRLAGEAMTNLSPDLTLHVIALTAPPLPFVPLEHVGKVVFCLATIGFGAEESHQRALDGLRADAPPLFEMVAPMPYTALQQMFDEAYDWGFHAYEKSTYLGGLSDEAIPVIVDQAAGMASPVSVVHFYALNGAYCAPTEESTAFGGGRSPRIAVFIVGVSTDAAGLPVERAWARGMFQALAPYALGDGAYVNGMVADDAYRVADSYGPKYERLTRIKAIYDPQNVFHRNANIHPASG
jgi:hypothetical protein